jgi:hypothetical protein
VRRLSWGIDAPISSKHRVREVQSELGVLQAAKRASLPCNQTAPEHDEVR